MPDWTRQRSAVIFVAAFVFIALFQIFVPDSFRLDSSDYTYYHSVVARNLLAGNGFTLADGSFASTNPPLYPIIVAMLLWVAQLGISEGLLFGAFNAACLAISVVVVYRLARNLWGERGGLLAAVLWLTYPFALLLSTERLTEPPFIAALYVGIAIFWHNLKSPSLKGFALAALFLSVAMLIRSVAIAIIPVCVFIVWLAQLTPQQKLAISGVFLGVGSLITLTWTLTIYVVSNQFVFLGTTGTMNIIQGMTFTLGRNFPISFQTSADVSDLMERIFMRRGEMVTLGKLVTVTWEEAQRSPAAFLKLLMLKAARSWYATDTGRLENISMLFQIFYFTIIILGSIIAIRIMPTHRDYIRMVWLIVFYFWFIVFVTFSILRYMTPIMGLLMTLAAGISHLRAKHTTP